MCPAIFLEEAPCRSILVSDYLNDESFLILFKWYELFVD